MLKKSITILCLSLFCAGFSFANSHQNIINTSHSGSIDTMVFSEYEDRLITGGSDGMIKIWDSETQHLEFQLQISNMPIRKLSVCQSKSKIAVITSDGINAVDISVWDWQNGRMLFSNRLSEIPTFIEFSPKGNFIVYGKTDWNSLVFLDAKNGSILKPIEESFGIVSSVFITESEKTLLTYNSSGSIQYWNLQNGERKIKIPTIANLDKTSFSSNGRYMTGYNGRKIILVDLQSGKEIGSTDIENAILSPVAPKSDKLVFCSTLRNEVSFTTLGFSGDGFKVEKKVKSRNTLMPNVIFINSSTVYSADSEGNIYSLHKNDEKPMLFAENNLMVVDDFCLTDSFFTASVNSKIFSLPADLFANSSKPESLKKYKASIIETKSDASFGLSKGRGEDILLWESACKGVASISTLNIERNNIQKISELPIPLISADYSNNRILTLDKNGECRIINYDNGEVDFSYSSYGIRTIDFIDKNNIIAGRNTSKTINSPLLHINTTTGETVPIENNNLLIFDLQYDELGKKLFTMGFEERNGSLRTVLKQHTGSNFDKSSTLLAYYGEDIDSTFVNDDKSTKIFTSVGQSGIQMLFWGGFTSLEKTLGIPKKLNLNNDVIIALNKDSSFSVFDQTSGKKLMCLYIFKDLGWLIVLEDGEYFAYDGSEQYIN